MFCPQFCPQFCEHNNARGQILACGISKSCILDTALFVGSCLLPVDRTIARAHVGLTSRLFTWPENVFGSILLCVGGQSDCVVRFGGRQRFVIRRASVVLARQRQPATFSFCCRQEKELSDTPSERCTLSRCVPRTVCLSHKGLSVLLHSKCFGRLGRPP